VSTVRDLLYREPRMVGMRHAGAIRNGLPRASWSIWRIDWTVDNSKRAGEGTPLTKYAYDGTYEWV